MTTFYADIRLYTNPRHDAETIFVEVPAEDLHHALQVLMAWKAGLAANPRFDTAMEESLAASRTRGRKYLTLREASQHLRNNVFG